MRGDIRKWPLPIVVIFSIIKTNRSVCMLTEILNQPISECEFV